MGWVTENKSIKCCNFHCVEYFTVRVFLMLLSSCNFVQYENLQFLWGPSEQGLGKPQERGRGFRFKIGDGKDEWQSNGGVRKHCNEVTNVKLTHESILMPTSREGQAWHGRIVDLTEQFGHSKYEWNPTVTAWRAEATTKAPTACWRKDSLERLLVCLVRPDSRLGRPCLA